MDEWTKAMETEYDNGMRATRQVVANSTVADMSAMFRKAVARGDYSTCYVAGALDMLLWIATDGRA